MTITPDIILDRIKLKNSIKKWRIIAILAITLVLITVSFNNNVDSSSLKNYKEHIAKIKVEGIILEDPDKDAILNTIAEDPKIKALIVYINSPGGTIVGGENFYNSLRKISKNKPVVAVMGSLAASGGYMTAIGADRIFAREGTITGSVGVLLQSVNVTELGKKIGLEFITFKSGKLKATPSPFEKLIPEAEESIKESIADSFNMFLDMVVKRRQLSAQVINQIKDGRIFTGRQALKIGLIDAIGGEEEAVKWLQDEKGINKKLKIINVELDSNQKFIEKILSKAINDNAPVATIKHGGILALWNP